MFICGSLNQTTMLHQVSGFFSGEEVYFSPYYADGVEGALAKTGVLDFSILGGKFRRTTMEYLQDHKVRIDEKGKQNKYDMVFTCSDLIMPTNIMGTRIVLVQEGMTDPENLSYHLVRFLRLPRYLASTSTTGLSDLYDIFCVASEGYKDKFVSKGVNPEKVRVTGIPNFDDIAKHNINSFPHKGFCLVATSDARETYKLENRKAFIREALSLSEGKQMIFKLHPNERFDRAIREIKEIIPDAIVFTSGNINEMIANCDILVTKYSTVVYVGLALGKKCYSYFNLEELKKLVPVQNGATSAANIAREATELLNKQDYTPTTQRNLPPSMVFRKIAQHILGRAGS